MDCAVLLLSVLFGFGLYSFSHAILRDYHYVNLKMTWTDAQRYCKMRHTDLATIESTNDISRLNRPSSDTSWLWIGLRVDPESWKGVLGNDTNSWRWSATGNTSKTGYYNWQPGQPKVILRDHTCVQINSDGTWTDLTCQNAANFLCYDAANPPSQKTFIFYRYDVTWEVAKNYCRTHHTDLAMIENAQENAAAVSVKLNYTGGPVWIGLYQIHWSWSDMSSSTFTNWASGQPDGKQYCAAERSDHLWEDVSCDSKISFFCYGDLKVKKTVMRMKIQTDADLSDPAINAQVLQQLGAVLTNKALLTDFNLQWTIQPRKQTKRNEENDEANGQDVLCI